MGWMSTALAANGFALREAYASPIDPDVGPDQLANWPDYYRKLTKSNARDLDPLDQDRMIKIALYLYDTNPLARRLIELITDFVVGEGITFTAGDARVQAVLEAFWEDPINDWPVKQDQRFRQLLIFGEQIWPVFVRRADGRVRLGYVDPEQVRKVEVNPDNAEERLAIQLKASPGRMQGLTIPIIRKDESPGDTMGLLIAPPVPVFDHASDASPYGTIYLSINHVSNSARGRSELLTAFDWLDLFDQFLFSQAERSAYLSDHLWDVTLEGMTEEGIRAWLAKNKTPQGNAMRAHNEKVKWAAVSPDLRSADVSEQARTIREQIVMGAGGFPEHWLFSGRDANKATAAAQDTPVMKHLSRRQRQWKAIVRHVLAFVRDQAIIAKVLPKDLTEAQRAIKIHASEVSTKDTALGATTLKVTAESLVVAQDRKWVTADEAAQLYRRLATEMGVELLGGLPRVIVTGDAAEALSSYDAADLALLADRIEETMQRVVQTAEVLPMSRHGHEPVPLQEAIAEMREVLSAAGSLVRPGGGIDQMQLGGGVTVDIPALERMGQGVQGVVSLMRESLQRTEHLIEGLAEALRSGDVRQMATTVAMETAVREFLASLRQLIEQSGPRVRDVIRDSATGLVQQIIDHPASHVL